jgi:hypothetical protein
MVISLVSAAMKLPQTGKIAKEKNKEKKTNKNVDPIR